MVAISSLSPTEAALACIICMIAFVASLYTGSKEIRSLPRNTPRVMVHRIKIVSANCIIAPVVIWMYLNLRGIRMGFLSYLSMSGITFAAVIPSIVVGLALPVALFLGPLLSEYLESELPFQKNSNFKNEFGTLMWIRSIIIGPISEELYFRSYMVPIALSAGYNSSQTTYLLPLVFGFAHFHHGFEIFVRSGKNVKALKMAVLTSAFQFIYTYVFGIFATHILLKTGNVIAPIISHMFCNYMGFPDFSAFANPRNKKNALIIGAFVCGVALFSFLLPKIFPETLFHPIT
ncbi:hypothetical protein BC829DRAFT_120602 [Chytridium lagenaria]|nr:hypothetical protein BC829DRAFT_120602 [Chytridium lagenaria]